MNHNSTPPNTLKEKVSDYVFLYEAWNKLDKSNKYSSGLSGETIQDFERNLKTKLEQISKELKNDKFSFGKTKAVAIPKVKGGYRPLQVPEIRDRVVIKAIAIIVELELESVFNLNNLASFAYQKKLGVEDAIFRMFQLYNLGNEIILEADIEKFFDSLNRELLLDELVFPNLSDNSINSLILGALTQKVGGLEKLSSEAQEVFALLEGGIPQGNALSPLCSNLYLNSFDLLMLKNDFNLVRYADDFIVLCKSNREAKKAYKIALSELEGKLKLKLHPLGRSKKSKTRILKPSKKKEFSFLSIQFDGSSLIPTPQKYFQFKENLRRAIYENKNDSILGILQKVNNMIEGWISNYYYCNVEEYIDDLDDFIDTHLYNKLRKCDWRFTRNSLQRRNWKGKELRLKLGKRQRLKSGINPCNIILDNKRTNGRMERWERIKKGL